MKEVIISKEGDYRIRIVQLEEDSVLVTKEEYEGMKKIFEGQ